MRILHIPRLILLALVSSFFFSCNEKEELVSEPLSDYMPLAVGKYITYRIDSLVFPNFGRSTEVHAYQVKHQVEALTNDNIGNPLYKVYRYLRDSAGTQPWQAAGSYFITPLGDQVETAEDNLRVIKLHLPLKSGFSWKGNRYLPTDPFGPIYNFSNDDNMADWDFFYDGNAASFSYGGQNYSNVFTVEQVDESFNVPITSPGSYAAQSRSVERYSKSIGMVFRQFEIWEYQPNTGGSGGPYKTGFGITMWMIDHN